MEKKDILNKALAIAGTVLLLFSILAPVFLSLVSLIERGVFRFDYLMPLELLPVVLVGGGLLLWVALRARSCRKLIGWSLGLVVGLFALCQLVAVFAGLASGETDPAGFWWAVVLASIIAYSLALISIGVGGILLLCDLFKPEITDNPSA